MRGLPMNEEPDARWFDAAILIMGIVAVSLLWWERYFR